MTQEHLHNEYPTLEEIIAASKPGVAAEQRSSIKEKLAGFIPADEAVAGAVKFLEDHQYDFDALHDFLETPADFSTSKIKSSPVILIRRFSVAAACLIILSGAVWYYLNRETPAKIIAKSVFHEPGLPVFASVQGNTEFHELMSAYKMQDAKSGLGYYYALISKEPANDTLNYFGGWLFYMNGQPDSAAFSFEKAASFKPGIYHHKAQYMLAASLYLTGKMPTAKIIFENIVQDSTNPYKENVAKLLADKKLW